MEFPIRKKYFWADNVTYNLIRKDGSVKEFTQESCFSQLPENCSNIDKIVLYNLDCELTKDYRNWYLQYIIDMLQLDVSFDEQSFTFKAFNCRYKNMLVCSLTRILWEKMFMKDDCDNIEWVLKPLKKARKPDKLSRFCKVFQSIPIKDDYLHDGHLPNPNKVKIKTQQDWLKSETLNSVNGFFY